MSNDETDNSANAPTLKDLGIDKLPIERQLAIAHEIFESVYGPPPGMMSEEEAWAEAERRDRELDEHPERALSLEQLLERLGKPNTSQS
jgi:putative addiction module component (TIGR02574 family)